MAAFDMDEEIFWLALALAAAAAAVAFLGRRLLAAARSAAAAEAFRHRPARRSPVRRERVPARPAAGSPPVSRALQPPLIQGQARPVAAGVFSDSQPLLLLQPAREIDRQAFLEAAELPSLEAPFLAALALPEKPAQAPLAAGVRKSMPEPLLEIVLLEGAGVMEDGLSMAAFGPGWRVMGSPLALEGRGAAEVRGWIRALKAAAAAPWAPLALRQAARGELDCIRAPFSGLSREFQSSWEAALGFARAALADPASADPEAARLLASRCEAEARSRLAVLRQEGTADSLERRLPQWRECAAVILLWRAALPLLAASRPDYPALPHAICAFSEALEALSRASAESCLSDWMTAPDKSGAPGRPDPLAAEKARIGRGLEALFSKLERSAYALSLPPRLALKPAARGWRLCRLDATAEGFKDRGASL